MIFLSERWNINEAVVVSLTCTPKLYAAVILVRPVLNSAIEANEDAIKIKATIKNKWQKL